jgi:hypothetical protein
MNAKPLIRRKRGTKKQWECYLRGQFLNPDDWVFLACGQGKTPKAAYDEWASQLASNLVELGRQQSDREQMEKWQAAWAIERKKASLELFGRDDLH